jgi:PAS domain S-box-containing protein
MPALGGTPPVDELKSATMPVARNRLADEAEGSLDALTRPRAPRPSLQTLIEGSLQLTFVHRDGVVALCNSATAKALSLASVDDLTGTPLDDLFHPEERALVDSRIRAPDSGLAEQPFRLRWRCKNGSYLTTETAAMNIELDGSPAVVVVARDVTESAALQHQLLQRDRMAALGTLAAGVAHEINNPLTYLLVNVDLVLRRLRAASASDDPLAALAGPEGAGDAIGLPALVESLQRAVEGADRVAKIVRHLLTFAEGNVERRGLVDVRGIVESAAQMAWHEIRHRARLSKNLAEVPPVEANQARLGQVFLSLLLNAAQAIPEGQADRHEVSATTRTDDLGNAVVEIRDTGGGISPEHLPHIFEPFFTTKGSRRTGLGLAISQGAIKAMGGEITVQSSMGQGTTFRVVLRPALPWRGISAHGHEGRATPRRRVLVVDDERLVGEAIARSLSQSHDVAVVTDAREVLDRVGSGEVYDVILCDLMMPVMTGMDLYADMIAHKPELAQRFVFMTGGAFTEGARAFVQCVARPCLEKPLDMSRLRGLIARAGSDD